jgi:PIN domain nuclease of toxin-antitoxin system
VIILDTHVWVWWVHGDPRLPDRYAREIARREHDGLGISAISCWEVAKLVEYGRLTLPYPVNEWMEEALVYPQTRLLDLSPLVAVESTRLPPPFHKDPADQIIVATARIHDCELLTLDHKIRGYAHVKIVA